MPSSYSLTLVSILNSTNSYKKKEWKILASLAVALRDAAITHHFSDLPDYQGPGSPEKLIGVHLNALHELDKVKQGAPYTFAQYRKDAERFIQYYHDHPVFEVQQKQAFELLMQRLHYIDKLYYGKDCIKTMLSCQGKGDNLGGANPNAGLESDAFEAMKENSHHFTSSLFRKNKTVNLVSSPLRGSLQTAAALLPEVPRGMPKPVFSTHDALVENNAELSGKNIRSGGDIAGHWAHIWVDYFKEQFNIFQPMKLLAAPFKLLFRLVSSPFALASVKGINKDIQAAETTIGQKSTLGTHEVMEKNTPKYQSLLRLIKQGGQDNWFFGHDKTFRELFGNYFLCKEKFEDGDLRTVYRRNKNVHILESAPYVIHIDQETGRPIPKILKLDSDRMETLHQEAIEKDAGLMQQRKREEEDERWRMEAREKIQKVKEDAVMAAMNELNTHPASRTSHSEPGHADLHVTAQCFFTGEAATKHQKTHAVVEDEREFMKREFGAVFDDEDGDGESVGKASVNSSTMHG